LPAEARLAQLETKTALIEKDVETHSELFVKIDKSLEKLTDISNNLMTMVSVQASKIEQFHTEHEDLKEQVKVQEVSKKNFILDNKKYFIITFILLGWVMSSVAGPIEILKALIKLLS
jgi:t-SNARE complex subunit (syntaxin)